ncbi:hypothetical protein GMB86_07630 [Terrilactibacillus sp. BCM23-1]|uniref:Uncharacterized protein n=1 Tax=Terrilactibacillus tamarindi TaxID=2599694 RepID=A0A6N8CNZ6_9BACI|nr:hypothetical protein [Terrilactibacillus tamarindi]MTT31879.1 hypothetical protein [Terrilactibacillus tamarindi]
MQIPQVPPIITTHQTLNNTDNQLVALKKAKSSLQNQLQSMQSNDRTVSNNDNLRKLQIELKQVNSQIQEIQVQKPNKLASLENQDQLLISHGALLLFSKSQLL